MRIGQLAARAGVNPQTIRFYERQRVLDKPLRSSSGYREYCVRDLENLCVIRQCQQLGFTLKEAAQLLRLHQSVASDGSRHPLPKDLKQIATLARRRLHKIDEKLGLLQNMRRRMMRMIQYLEAENVARCPVSRT